MTETVERLFEALQRQGSIEDLGLVIDAIRDVYQLDHVVYHALSLGRSYVIGSSRSGLGRLAGQAGFWRRDADSLIAVTYAPEWGARYVEQGYERIDPVLEAAPRSFAPFDWKTLPWDTRKRRQFLREAVECGIGNQGYSIPVRGPDGQFAIFTINKNCSDEDWDKIIRERARDFLIISHFFHQRVLEIERIFGDPPAPALSVRERDVLSFIASGKNRAQTAEKLQISENTLRVYLDSARHKLGALNIPHAIAIGVRKGLLNIT